MQLTSNHQSEFLWIVERAILLTPFTPLKDINSFSICYCYVISVLEFFADPRSLLHYWLSLLMRRFCINDDIYS